MENSPYRCPFCGEWVSEWFHCCEGKHRSDWIEAQYQTMKWQPTPIKEVEDVKKNIR